MRAALFSDSHGDVAALRSAMEAAMLHGRVDVFAFLGDGIHDFLDLQPFIKKHNPLAVTYAVRGNNDPVMPELKEEQVVSFAGIWVLLTHGHRQRVKLTDRLLIDDARDRQCRIALFGHTHRAFQEEKEGILLMNPGSVAIPAGKGPSAGLIEIGADGRIMPQILNLRMYLYGMFPYS